VSRSCVRGLGNNCCAMVESRWMGGLCGARFTMLGGGHRDDQVMSRPSCACVGAS
jgi:hypothetical protein